jgi:hypothetical protein
VYRLIRFLALAILALRSPRAALAEIDRREEAEEPA